MPGGQRQCTAPGRPGCAPIRASITSSSGAWSASGKRSLTSSRPRPGHGWRISCCRSARRRQARSSATSWPRTAPRRCRTACAASTTTPPRCATASPTPLAGTGTWPSRRPGPASSGCSRPMCCTAAWHWRRGDLARRLAAWTAGSDGTATASSWTSCRLCARKSRWRAADCGSCPASSRPSRTCRSTQSTRPSSPTRRGRRRPCGTRPRARAPPRAPFSAAHAHACSPCSTNPHPPPASPATSA
jgi:hypothetical protein